MVNCSRSSIEPVERSPCFFKVIRYPSSPHLALPDAFVSDYLEKIPKNPTIKTATGGHLWKLEFLKIGEDYCFVHGWEKLAKDVQLCMKDIVVFWLTDPFTFQVSFLDANGCDKDLPLYNKSNNECKSVDGHDEDLCFEKVFSRKTHKYSMVLPVKFVKAAGLENKMSVKVVDHEGKEWTMRMVVDRYHGTKYSLSNPWCRFQRYHRLSEGDVCLFKFDKKESVLSLIKVVRNKTQPQHRIGSGSGMNVKIEDEWSPVEKTSVGTRARAGAGGGAGAGAGDADGVKVKVEYESGGEVEVANRKRALEKRVSGVKVKIGDGSGSVEGVKKKMGRLSNDKLGTLGGRANGKIEPQRERLLICKRVIYF